MSMNDSMLLIGDTISKLSVGGPTNITKEGVAKTEKDVEHVKRLLEALADMVTAVTYYLANAPKKGVNDVQNTDKAGK